MSWPNVLPWNALASPARISLHGGCYPHPLPSYGPDDSDGADYPRRDFCNSSQSANPRSMPSVWRRTLLDLLKRLGGG